jgi:isopenicillin N synthase-like dioxygenase
VVGTANIPVVDIGGFVRDTGELAEAGAATAQCTSAPSFGSAADAGPEGNGRSSAAEAMPANFSTATEAGRAARITAAVDNALGESGFMYVRGHGIDPAMIERAFAVSRRFFALPEERKRALLYGSVEANFGFQGIEAESLDPRSKPDLKEAFTMRNARAWAAQADRWPDAEFRDMALAFYDTCFAAATRILGILAATLNVPPDFFAERHLGENVTLRFLHYPANLPARAEDQLGAGAHTDYGSITLLFQDDVGGLEVRGADGTWRLAPPLEDAIVINTGDLMERWTNGRFRSTVHRVRPVRGDRDRYSIAFFVDPDSAVEVACIPGCLAPGATPRYPPITAGEHIRQKIAATHG